MSSKYHWTQELTNPQDRFRLYQQVMSLSTNTTIPILAEVGQYKSWSETLVRIACESSRYWNYFLQAGSYHPSAITDPDELEILTTLDNTFTELIKHSVSEEIREEINEYLTLNVAKRSTSFDIMDYLKIRFDHESAAIHYHNNFGWMDELPQLPFRKKYFLIQKFMEFLEEGLVGKAGEPLKTIEERKQFINETTANLLLIQAPKERDIVLNERKFQPHLVPAEVLHIVTGSGVSVPSTYHDGYATTVTQHQNSFQKQFKPKNPRKPTCGHCGKPHKLSQCIDYYQTNPNADIFKRFGHPGQEPQIPRSYCAYLDSDQPTPNAWIWDTGATNHMCGDKQYFINYSKLEQPNLVRGISGELYIHGYGTVMIDTMTLKKVAYVPGLKVNLISMTQIVDNGGIHFIGKKNKLLIFSKQYKTPQTIYRQGGCYIQTAPPPIKKHLNPTDAHAFAAEVVAAQHNNMLPSKFEPIPKANIFHARLGHPNYQVYNVLAKTYNLPKITKDQWTQCPTCNLGKGINHTGSLSKIQYKHPLQLVQIDLCGYFSYPNPSNYKFFLTICDAYTRMYFVFPIQHKWEATEAIINWINESETFFTSKGGYKVTTIRSDNGTEFQTAPLLRFLKQRGISHQLTVPHNSFQNGGVERAHRTLEERTRCLLLGGHVPVSYWPEALLTAAYLLNRTPVQSRDYMVPLNKWHNDDQDHVNINQMHIFGCSAYATVPSSDRGGKFNATSIRGVFLGFDPQRKAYRILDLHSRNVFTSNQVKFDENHFPFEQLLDTKTTPMKPYSTTSLKGVSTVVPPASSLSSNLETKQDILNRTNSASDDNSVTMPDTPSKDDSPVTLQTDDTPPTNPTANHPSPVHKSEALVVNDTPTIQPPANTTSPVHKSEALAVPDSHLLTTSAATTSGDVTNPKRMVPNSPSKDSSQQSVSYDDLQHAHITKSRKIELSPLPKPTVLPQRVQTINDETITQIDGQPIPSSILKKAKAHIDNHTVSHSDPLSVGRTPIPHPDAIANLREKYKHIPDRFLHYIFESSLSTSEDESTEQSSDPELVKTTTSSINDKNISTAFIALEHAFASQATASHIPRTVQEAKLCSQSKEWIAACLQELDSFKRLNVYTLVELPPGRRALGVRWVFTLKDSGLKKARLVAQGFRQKEGIDYQETFAPVIRYDSVRIFLSVSAHLNLRVHQMDVNTAFLNSRMTDTVYVKQPPGFLDPLQPNAVWKLSGGMYGLKQSPLLWNNHINSSLIKFGFSRHQSEYGLYYKQTSDGLILVALYVDDLLLAAPTPKLMNITKSQLSKAYSMKDLGPVSKFLGMNVSQSQNGNIFLSLEDYIVKAASISEVPTHKRVHTPLSSSTDYFNDKSPLLDSPTAYQSLVGQLLFVANTGRPDIAYPISVLSRFLKAPRQVHLIAAQRIMQYLYTTRKHGLSYKSDRPLNLAIYSDASYGSATDLPMSTGGYITFLADGMVSWKSNKIKSVCQSSTEAEYVAASDALREMAWISNLCDEIKKPLKDKVLYVDNQPAIRIAENPVLHDKIKHIQVKYHYIRQQVAEKNVRIQYVPTKSQLADIMTKIIPRTQYEVLRNSILTSA
ncbi:hypothetical protein B1J91_Tkp57 [Nakaseomyces glabratus]|nr:hypothetical protein B1J91_Tkp57 [Nakaseomyces glabratus]